MPNSDGSFRYLFIMISQDGELSSGSSGECSTFGSTTLSAVSSFDIVSIEIWGFQTPHSRWSSAAAAASSGGDEQQQAPLSPPRRGGGPGRGFVKRGLSQAIQQAAGESEEDEEDEDEEEQVMF